MLTSNEALYFLLVTGILCSIYAIWISRKILTTNIPSSSSGRTVSFEDTDHSSNL